MTEFETPETSGAGLSSSTKRGEDGRDHRQVNLDARHLSSIRHSAISSGRQMTWLDPRNPFDDRPPLTLFGGRTTTPHPDPQKTPTHKPQGAKLTFTSTTSGEGLHEEAVKEERKKRVKNTVRNICGISTPGRELDYETSESMSTSFPGSRPS